MKLCLRVLLSAVIAVSWTTCASAPPVTAPDWTEMPPSITESLCRRLRMDALATGAVTVVGITQPLATPESVQSLARIGRRRKPLDVSAPVHRAIPVRTEGGSCRWKTLGALDPRPADEMIVELSAPIVNPWVNGEAGVFARASLGGEATSWYWIALVPAGRTWAVRFVSVLPR
jgi:hypothetical protein